MQKVTQEYLERKKSRFYPTQQWIKFCETLLKEGYRLKVYEAKTTRGKYILVNNCYKVRFSNHCPSFTKQIEKDSDFYVGCHNFGVTTTADALRAVKRRFNRA